MYKRQQRLARRTFRFERLELRALLAGDVAWNNSSFEGNPNWELLAGQHAPATNTAPFYFVDDNQIEMKVSSNKLVIGFAGTRSPLPDYLKEDFGLAGIANVFATTQAVTPELIANIERIPGVTYTAPVFVTSDTSSELALLDEFIVQLKPGSTPESFFETLPEVASYRRLEGTTDQYVGRFSNFMGRKALDRTNLLQGNPNVAWVEPNFYQNWQRYYTPNDPRFANLWHLNNTGGANGLADADVDMPEAWDINQGGSSSIVIAIIDDGVQAAHPDLNVWTNPGEIAGDGVDNDGNGWIDDIRGWNFVLGNNQTEPLGTDRHGTSVAGVAAARGNNGLGVVGAAYNSQVISIKMFDGSSVASTANIAAALRYGAGIKASGTGTWDGADIVNNSWGGGASSATINSALTSGTTIGRGGLGATYLFASGNDFAASVSQPAAQSANIAGVIAVGATNNLGTRSNYSNYGTALDFVAPSNDTRAGYLAIDTTDRTSTNGYASGDYTGTGSTGFGGTSSATPLSTGIAALALAQADVQGITISPSNLRGLMRNNTDLIAGATYNISTGKQNEYGFGRINAASLLAGIGNAEISVTNTTNELFSGTEITLGNLVLGQSLDTNLRIRNQGTQTLEISSITVPAPFSVVNFSASSLPVGGTMNFVVRYTPTTMGSFSENLIINNNDANEGVFSLRFSASALGPRISGNFFEDFDNSASRNTFERGITSSGFAYIDANNNSVYDLGEQQSTLDVTGNYSFAVPNGTYRIRAELPGWTRTTANASYLVNLTTNDDVSEDNNFGFAKNNRFYAFVYEDVNQDGSFNGSDVPRKDFVVNAGKASYSNATPVPIPDLATVISPITIPANSPGVSDLDILINISHTYTGDLEIALIGPDNTTINLSDNRGGSGDNFTNTIFDDAATTLISTGLAPFTGRFRPDQALSVFNGKLSPGLWQLRAKDVFAQDIGTLLNWRMDFNGTQIATSDLNGWAIVDLGIAPVTARLELQPDWQYSQPSNGQHALTPNGTPIFGRAFGIRGATLPPTDISLSSAIIPENSSPNTLVGTLSTTDPDAGDTFTYTLVAGTGDTDNTAFNIDGNSLRANNSFDFEVKSNYTIRIRSTDTNGLFIEKSFIIAVTDSNETPSDLSLSANSIPENAGSNAIVGTLSTTDPDAGDTFTYTLVAGTGDTDNTAFNIDGNSLRANNSFDFEAKSSYTIRIRSTDTNGLFIEKSFIIAVTDSNETPSDLSLSANSIPENAGSNAIVGTLSTTDPDAGDTFTYTLVAGTGDTDNTVFNIDGNSLRANNSFDFEAKSSYTIRIRSTDTNGLFIEKSFIISVTDSNEAPSDLSLSANSIPENAGSNAIVGTLSTTDPDAGDTFTYTLVAGTGDTDNTAFNIDGNSLRANNSFDFEVKSNYTIRIRSTDTNGLFIEKSFIISVTDSNEAPSDLSLSANSIPENAGSNAIVGTLSTTDPDAGDTFTYTLVAGTGDTDNTAFNIDGNSLRANNSFDFEVKSNYTIRIRSTDTNGLFIEKSFIIAVTDSNETPSDLSLSANSIPENAGSNAIVGTLSTTDPDAGDTFTYTLVAGTGDTDNTAFNIDGNSLRANNSFDFEVKSNYAIRIRSTDAGGLFIEKEFIIQIQDLAENVLVQGTSGNDAFIATYTGDGTTHSWNVTRGGIAVFNGPIPLGNTLLIDGLAGTDSLQIKGLATNDLFVLESNRVTLNGSFVQFPGVETLRATGELGNDTLRVTEMLTAGTSFSFDGGTGTDWVESNTSGNTWNITGIGIGNLDGTLPFTTVESLRGSSGDDQFLFGVNGRVTGQVLGGQGNDTLNLSAKTAAHTINLQTNTATSTGGIGGIENFIGGNNASVTDVFIGANSATLWTINATNAGQLSSSQTGTINFQNFESLTGGTASDNFTFTESGSLSRAIIGGTATGVFDVIDLSAKSSPLDIQLNTTSGVLSAIGSYSGIEQVNGNGVAGTKIQRINNVATTWAINASGQIAVSGVTYNSIGTIVGGPGVDSLTGPNISSGTNTWTLASADAGTLAMPGSILTFSSINNITGGTGADSFEVLPSASLSGNLNAGTGTGLNSISYAQWTAAVTVNLALTTAGNATAIAGNLSNIQMLVGGSGNDTLTGQTARSTILVGLNGADSLTGGSQRDILIGGLGADIILGAAGDDILVSGSTQYDADRSALFSIYSEWISTRTFAQRTANIWGNGTGTRSNGTNFFNSNATDGITDTVFADEDIDTLTGGLNQDWFFASLADTVDLSTATPPDRLDR